ncbi:AI-2E family transporter [Paraneptunicella aestuarii]|uniref:AI-2E family transporter n=1 Tax=Paraneptunicella aestuarii TaxID=2831148 RepID=UPI001E5C1374|nr:AI-2E family transporter [Paraneptunicella aestuarii]UAA40341.1 AI-2E family transporter [Paraneptunicella aestuarii]
MFEVFGRWYKRKFSDPDSAMLLFLLIISSLILLFWGNMLAPVIVAIVLAYLLDWPVVRLQNMGLSRTYASSVVLLLFVGLVTLATIGLVPVIWQQSLNLANEMPQIWEQAQAWITALPNNYPQFINVNQIEKMLSGVDERVVKIGEGLLSASFSSLFGAAALLIYLILVPIMVLFMLKDKQQLLDNISNLLPKERRLIKQVGQEMNIQILNYIRGKVIEIIIVGTVSTITFALMDLRYSLLLGVLVGFSVLIPYIGAAVVTLPIAAVALFQWGITPDFWSIMVAYAIIQALDGNVLVPVLFSEAVSLHPVYIIIAVLFFGGLWGFWGVFFAIPLASLVRALFNAWSSPKEFSKACDE